MPKLQNEQTLRDAIKGKITDRLLNIDYVVKCTKEAGNVYFPAQETGTAIMFGDMGKDFKCSIDNSIVTVMLDKITNYWYKATKVIISNMIDYLAAGGDSNPDAINKSVIIIDL